MAEHLELPYITFGCDPEFFLEKDGKIIGAEKILPKAGLLGGQQFGNVIIDGVQAEINTNFPGSCRAHTAIAIKDAFVTLKKRLVGIDGVKPNFSTMVEITKTELDSLSDSCKVFGCAPSKNLYHKEATVGVDASKYLKRSGGGHIHLGGIPCSTDKKKAERYVRMLDIMVGNTCVMMDRDPFAPERRKNYGRAGEYRTPHHGVEYRTLSNFWLQAFPLASFVMGISRMAIGVVHTTINRSTPRQRTMPVGQYDEWYGVDGIPPATWNPEKELLDALDLPKVEKAINENDLDLAKENWQIVKGFIEDHVPLSMASRNIYSGASLWNGAMPAFEYFLENVQKHGFKFWFPEDPFDHWTSLYDGHYCGWENFLLHVVTPKMKKEVNGAKVDGVTLEEALAFVKRENEYPGAKRATGVD